MICEKCQQAIPTAKKSSDPWCMYQVSGNKVINQMFDPQHIPDGWYDSPKAAREGPVAREALQILQQQLTCTGGEEVIAIKRSRRTKAEMEAARVELELKKSGELDVDSTRDSQQSS